MGKLLVTGGAGFIGANFVHYWRKQHPDDEVVVLDALTYAGRRDSLRALEGDSGFSFVHGDIRDQALAERLLLDRQLDTIVHFAAESHVDRSIDGPDVFVDTNVNGTLSLLKAARKVWLEKGTGSPHRFHHVSTDEVYGSLEVDDPPFHEETPYAPNSPYSASKAASDHLVRAYHHTFGLQITTTNCSNNYGPYQYPEKLIPLFLINALHGRPLPMYGDGQNVRDWLFVSDHCVGIDLVLDAGSVGATYCLGGQCELRNTELVSILCETLDSAFERDDTLARQFPNCPPAQGGDSKSLITFVSDRLGHDRRYAIDISRANLELGFTPANSIRTGLTQTVRWYLENADWWTSVLGSESQVRSD